MNKSNMSKKAAISGMALTAIGSSDDWRTQLIIAGVAVVAILVQGALDMWRDGKEVKSHGSA